MTSETPDRTNTLNQATQEIREAYSHRKGCSKSSPGLAMFESRPRHYDALLSAVGLLRPGGYLVSYDSWINPFNLNTVGIRRRELQRLFPDARLRAERTITLAPPIRRVLSKLGSWPVLGLEKLRFLNTHHRVALSRERE